MSESATTTTGKPTVMTADAAHSNVGFTVRHLMISKVRGRFRNFEATLRLDEENPENSEVEAKIAVASVDTGEEDRDNHLRSADFFDAENHPQMTFESKRIERVSEDRARVVGDLTIRGTTREVTLDVERLGENTDPWGNRRIAFAAGTKVNRKEYGLNWNQALETGGFLVGDEVRIELEIQFVEQKS